MEVMGSKSYVDKHWPKNLAFSQWMKEIFHTGPVTNTADYAKG